MYRSLKLFILTLLVSIFMVIVGNMIMQRLAAHIAEGRLSSDDRAMVDTKVEEASSDLADPYAGFT